MNRLELEAIDNLRRNAQAKVKKARDKTPRAFNVQDGLNREAIVAIDEFAAIVNEKWPEIYALLDQILVPTGISEVAAAFSKVAADEFENPATTSVAVRLDKNKHRL